MLLQSMVLSRDTDKVAVLMRAFSRLEIDVVVCSEPSSAIALMDRKKFEAVVIDFSVPGADTLLKDIQRQFENKTMIAAILGGETSVSEAFAMGAKFVLYEPDTLDRALQGLRAPLKASCTRNGGNNCASPLTLRCASSSLPATK